MTSSDELRAKLLVAAFRMPASQGMKARKTTITNAFVSALIPVAQPTLAEIEEALAILGMDPGDVRCAYCGDRASEWDHLRPLVLKRRPTGFISEIANLVPSCGKCNQSKGNKPWRQWMLSNAKLSPTGRRIDDTQRRIELLDSYERWRIPTQIDFGSIVGTEEWDRYWSLCEAVIEEMGRCQEVAEAIRMKITHALSGNTRPEA